MGLAYWVYSSNAFLYHELSNYRLCLNS
jgi:hypothetical protein